MKRKVIKQKDSFTITLPIKWAKAHGIEESREIDIEEEKEGLFIRPGAAPRKDGEITIRSENAKFVTYLLNNAYRNGYDLLTVHIAAAKDAKIVEEMVRLLLGWQVVEKTEKKIVLENLTEPRPEKFDSLLRRAFFIIKNDLEEIRNALATGKLDVKQIEGNADEVIRIDNFCRRCISKRVVEKEKTYFYWQLVSTITWVHRAIYYFATITSKKQAKSAKALVDNIIAAFDSLHEGFFGNDMKKISAVFGITKEIQLSQEKILKKSDNPLAYHYLLEIARLINLLCSPCIGILE